jgi:DNA repair ATPase RecN
VLLSLTGASGDGKSMALDAMVAAFDGQRVRCVEFARGPA